MSLLPKAARDNRANQLNPLHPAFERSRGASEAAAERITQQRRSAAAPDGANASPVSSDSGSSSNASSARAE